MTRRGTKRSKDYKPIGSNKGWGNKKRHQPGCKIYYLTLVEFTLEREHELHILESSLIRLFT